MPTKIETRIRRTAVKKTRVQITTRSRSSAGFDCTYPTGQSSDEHGLRFDHETVNVPTKKEALTLLMVKARVTSELLFKIVPRKQRANPWCDACHCYHVKPKDEAEHNELQCLKQWKEKKA